MHKYPLPTFNKGQLIAHIGRLVAHAPDGIVGLIVDLFCGAGGTSEGIEQAVASNGAKSFAIIAGINHDRKAIYSQAINHPLAYYTTEDIRVAKLNVISDLIAELKELFPNCPIIIWASLECTNHSNAKGGISRDADSRTLAWHMFRYIETLNPDGLWIENVREFAEWGPLSIKTVLIDSKGRRKTLSHEVPDEQQQRFFMQLAEQGTTSYCPLTVQKKSNKKKERGVYQTLVPIKSLKGQHFTPWREKVLDYGYHYEQWILNSADYGVPQSRKRLFLLFMRIGIQIVQPRPTHAKISLNGLESHIAVKHCLDLQNKGESIFRDGKIKSDKTYQRIYKGLVKFIPRQDEQQFLDVIYGNGYPSSINSSSPTVRTKDGLQLITAQPSEILERTFILSNYSSGGEVSSIDSPSPSILAIPKQNVVQVTQGNFLLNPQYGNAGCSIDEPAPTIIARQDKMPLQLISSDYSSSNQKYEVKQTDSDTVKKIKEFMRENNISDIFVRPLAVKELLAIQSFPENYFLASGSTDQKRFIGNAVPPKMAKAIAEAQYPYFKQLLQIKKTA